MQAGGGAAFAVTPGAGIRTPRWPAGGERQGPEPDYTPTPGPRGCPVGSENLTKAPGRCSPGDESISAGLLTGAGPERGGLTPSCTVWVTLILPGHQGPGRLEEPACVCLPKLQTHPGPRHNGAHSWGRGQRGKTRVPPGHMSLEASCSAADWPSTRQVRVILPSSAPALGRPSAFRGSMAPAHVTSAAP